MDIIVKGRRTEVSDRFREHARAKLAKIEKLDHKVILIDVEVSREPNPRQADRRERVELTIRSRGPVIRAEAAAEDRYGALDLALNRLESRLRKLNDRRKPHHGHRAPVRPAAMMDVLAESEAAAAVSARSAPAGTDVRAAARVKDKVGDKAVDKAGDNVKDRTSPDLDEHTVSIPMEGDGPVVLREKLHKAQPMTLEQALFEMELVGHDFFLFRDKETGHSSVVYRRRGWDYGVIRLVEE